LCKLSILVVKFKGFVTVFIKEVKLFFKN